MINQLLQPQQTITKHTDSKASSRRGGSNLYTDSTLSLEVKNILKDNNQHKTDHN